MPDIRELLNQTDIRTALRQAWSDSNPGPTGGHEEGGFICQDVTGAWEVIRWPRGQHDQIVVPPHQGCRIQDLEIIATFHTHPNTGTDYLQEPSETDKRAVRDDLDLKGDLYQGELVVAQENVYIVKQDGSTLTLGETKSILVQA